MPDRTWNPPHPTIWDRILHHGPEVTLAHFQLFACYALLRSELREIPPASPALAEIPSVISLYLTVLIGLGGVGIMFGLVGWPSPTTLWESIRTRRQYKKAGKKPPELELFDQFDNLRIRWIFERSGLGLSILAWLSYAIAVYVRVPGSVFTWALALAIAVGFAIRFKATLQIERAAIASVGRLRNQGKEVP